MYFDKKAFKGLLKAKNKKYDEVAEGIGMYKDTFSRRISENGIGFNIYEIHDLMETIPMSFDEMKSIFFKEKECQSTQDSISIKELAKELEHYSSIKSFSNKE